jgi:hypothetical protein
MKTKITGLVKELVDKECFKNQVLANLSGLQKKFKENYTEKNQMKATHRKKITRLKNKVEQKGSEKDQVIMTLCCQILEQTLCDQIQKNMEANLCSEKEVQEKAGHH